MKRRTWHAHTKAMIVLEGLQGQPVAELCTAQQISPSLYDPWRDQFLAQAAKAFDDPQRSRKEARLPQENARLKPRVGELTLELKKATSGCHASGHSRPSTLSGAIAVSGLTCLSWSIKHSTTSGCCGGGGSPISWSPQS
jgi:transposase-like protein